MTRYFKLALLLFGLGTGVSLAFSEDGPDRLVDIDALYLVDSKVKVDQDKVDRVVAEYKESINKKIKHAQYNKSIAEKVSLSAGKKCPEECLDFVTTCIEAMETDGYSEEAKKVRKDFSKGKINKKILPWLNEYIKVVDRKIYQLRNKLDHFDKNSIAKLFPGGKKPEIHYYDTIYNPHNRTELYKNGNYGDICKYDLAKMKEGLEWIYSCNEEECEYVDKDYPFSVCYYVLKSHPQYAVKGSGYGFDYDWVYIYDMEGRLAYVGPDPEIKDWVDFHSDEFRRQLYTYAYNQNAYDIQSKGPKVKHKIMLRVGLEKMTALEQKMDRELTKEFRRLVGALNEFGNASRRYGSGSSKTAKANAKVWGVLTKKSNKTSAEKAEIAAEDIATPWMYQIDKDWEQKFDRPWKAVRLSPTEFMLTFVDDEGIPTWDYKLEFKGDGPFNYKKKGILTFAKSKSSVFVQKPVSREEQSEVAYASNENPKEYNDKEEEEIYVAVEQQGEFNDMEEEDVYVAVEQQGEFPGGMRALMEWLSNAIRYPEAAKNQEIQGRVIVKFVIEKDGTITNPVIQKGVDSDLNKEALRVIKQMPRWYPAKNNGKPVRSYFNLPVTFKLPDL